METFDKVRFIAPKAEDCPLVINSTVTHAAGDPMKAAMLMMWSFAGEQYPEKSVTINLKVNAGASPLAGKNFTFNVTFEGEGK